MNSRRKLPELNTGSMADIAFLLLIFFLVTAMIPNDQGINRKLPRLCDTPDCTGKVKERNVFRITINRNNEIMINHETASITEVKELTKAFIDNNGDGSCYYCNGEQRKEASVHPTKAVISIATDRNTDYNTFINVQDAITSAYFELRKHYAKTELNKTIDELTENELLSIKKAYPFIISEAETK